MFGIRLKFAVTLANGTTAHVTVLANVGAKVVPQFAIDKAFDWLFAGGLQVRTGQTRYSVELASLTEEIYYFDPFDNPSIVVR